MGDAPAPIDVSLLAGLAFRCRPDCGLCCFATPRVTSEERRRLVEIEPAVPFQASTGGLACIADRGDGGACFLLSDHQCRAHAQRPLACREFPISVHIGARVQATAVLGCPGVDLSRFLDWADVHPPGKAPEGFDSELEAVNRELERLPLDRWISESERRLSRVARRLARRGQWDEPSMIEQALRPALLELVRSEFEVLEPPERSDGIATLPMFWDSRHGLVAIASHPGGWELLTPSEDGAESPAITVVPVPDSCPALDGGGERALRAYLRYLLARDCTYWQAAERIGTDGETGLLEQVADDLSEVGGIVLGRAVARRHLRGLAAEPLDAESVLDGVRATDAEFLDRPTLGMRP